MTKLETPLIHRYHDRVGGTLMEEYRVGRRLLDAVIIRDGKRTRLPRHQHASLNGQDVIVIETKGKRLNRYLAGQARYARPLVLKYYTPKFLYIVALCMFDDPDLRPHIEADGVQVVLDPEAVLTPAR